MQVTFNGAPREANLTLRRAAGHVGEEYLYVDDYKVARVTHSRVDEVPVVLVVDENTVVEVEPRAFYAIAAMNYDWQPGTQDDALSGG